MRVEIKTTKARATKTYVTSVIATVGGRTTTTLTCDQHDRSFVLAERLPVNLVTLARVRACPAAWCADCGTGAAKASKGTEHD